MCGGVKGYGQGVSVRVGYTLGPQALRRMTEVYAVVGRQISTHTPVHTSTGEG